eukprot:m.153527 g.153527  ORF g.153527 m.153527 type:complete len:74 (-) comp30839_c0_seq1:101-322(-)
MVYLTQHEVRWFPRSYTATQGQGTTTRGQRSSLTAGAIQYAAFGMTVWPFASTFSFKIRQIKAFAHVELVVYM